MKLSVIAVALLCVTGAAVAQTPPDPTSEPPGAQQHLDRLAVLLDLSDAQKAQVKAILDAEHAKMKAQFEAARAAGTKPSFEQMRAAREQLRADEIQQLSSVLNATQLKKFQVLQDEEHRPPFHGPRGGDPGGTSN